jgi:two-component sensor histidine kinase
LPDEDRPTAATHGRLLRQRAALAEFGAQALAADDLDRLLSEGARLCAEGLGVPFCKVLEHRPGPDDLLVRAGVGWRPGVVGAAILPADGGNPGGESFQAARPVAVPDLRDAEGLDLPDLFPQHGIVASANVPILGGGDGQPFGVLEADAAERRDFGPDDLDFLRGYAKVMGNAVRAFHRHAAARAESDARAVLLREQQHRVRNNLMAITAMLRDGRARRGGRGLAGALRRGAAAGVRHGVALRPPPRRRPRGRRTASLRDYLAALCAGARDFYGLAAGDVDLSFEADGGGPSVSAETCTILGILANELVANAVEHAFGRATGGGRIVVGLAEDAGGGAVVTVEDDGVGVAPGAETASLGLGFARKLLARIGYSLALRSAPGGTVWTIARSDTLNVVGP